MSFARRFAPVCAAVLALLPAAVLFAQEGETPKPSKTYPAQSTVAVKDKKFAVVKEGDAALTGALESRDLAKAKTLLNKQGKFVGTVVKVYIAPNNSLVILNFAKDFRNHLTAVLEPADYAKFPDLKMLADKKVLVSGKFVAYKQQVEIELTDMSQIKIVEEKPTN